MRHLGKIIIPAALAILIPSLGYAQSAGQAKQMQKLQEQQSVDTRFADYFSRLKKAPRDPQAHLALAQVYLERDLFELAAVSFQRALKLNPQLASAHFGLSKTYRKKKLKKLEVLELENAVAIEPTNDHYLYELGVVYMEPESFDYKKAKKQYKALKKLQSPKADKLGTLMKIDE